MEGDGVEGDGVMVTVPKETPAGKGDGVEGDGVMATVPKETPAGLGVEVDGVMGTLLGVG